MGRRKIDIDYALVEELARIQCTDVEIHTVLGISSNTFLSRKQNDKQLQEALARGRVDGKKSVRRKQYEVAMKGSVTMLIWLGKQWLGQLDEPLQENDNESLNNLINVLDTIRKSTSSSIDENK